MQNTLGWLKFHQVFYDKCLKINFSFPLVLSSFWIVLGKVTTELLLANYYKLVYNYYKLVVVDSCTGEFGVVYRAHLSSYEGRAEPGLVAVKTLKGTCT